ncbi:MAG: Histidinol-phosphate aminotransferase, partial [uncultured Nocardioidaceae bacterium]
ARPRVAPGSPGAARRRTVRRTAARRAGAAQHQREPLRSQRRGGSRHGECRRAGRSRPAPLSRPRGPGVARRPCRLPVGRRRSESGQRVAVGRQRVQRGDAAADARLRRPGTHRAVVRSDVLDVSGVRPKLLHPVGHRTPGRRLRARPGRRAGADRRGGAVAGAAHLAQQPDRHAPPVRSHRGRPGRRSGDGRHRRGLCGVPSSGRAQCGLTAGRPPPAGGHAHHEQGLRAGRRTARVRSGAPRRDRRATSRAAAVPPLGGDPGGRPGRPGARRRAARAGGTAARHPRPAGARPARARTRRGRLRRQLRAVRDLPGPARHLAGPARARRARARDRTAGVATGLGRHAGRDHRVPRGAAKGAGPM